MAEKDSKAKAPSTVKARVLVVCDYGTCNDVIEIDAELVDSLAGVVDTDPAAVAYAETLTKD
ncbi:hypothetical protein [Rugamonas rubra]|uniref:Uncharacterized protein n=1 Tax=Rugamonas rubra TaxID=758825 RepID=A0A1I4SHI6_9BURK|nr:hypothetical protein [Rugamonas rubra]SFM63770.1 hypothetical protein SAMN02982985_04773 [Rugamonas rubra]